MKLSYSTGVREYEVEGGVIHFNPCDTKFAERLYKCFDKLGKRQEDGEVENEELKNDGVKLFEAIKAKEAEMRGYIEEVFGEGTAKLIFPNTGLYAVADGLPVWANFLLAVIDEVDKSMEEQQVTASPRFDALMKKYQKYVRQ